MRKLLFALALMMGAFAFGAGSPASAMPASPVTGMSEIVKPDGTAQKVYHRRWHRHNYYYRPYYYRPYRYYYYRPYYRPYYYRRHHYRRYW